MEDILRGFIQEFKILTTDEVNTIVESSNIQSFDKGTLLLKEGEIAKECYFVLKGCIREYYIVDGIEKTTAFYTEMQPVNSFTSFTDASPSKHYLVCAEDSIVTVGTQRLEEEMCKRVPRLESIMRQEVERHSGELQDRLARFMTSSPEQRFIQLIEENPKLVTRVPQHQIASYLGITPESFSRIKKRIYKR
ncbi:Crp/Fnr family transcriptional regulator [Carboxylicivirga sp. N1Y90]|uniref:Crp/Fnr family transcriptional regulator n=1 Tax=Carboxylicivirga fragile TaxID=3417571 RepID=UPI003D32E33A|nr:Crp/Fnr family transcriptional regulator [Marinilabiliaceae bacterium N1Y90]